MDTKGFQSLIELGFLNPIDFHFAALMTRLAGSDDPSLFLAAALVSHTTTEGNVCLDLSVTAGQPLAQEGVGTSVVAPELQTWIRTLRTSFVVGRPGEAKPLILADPARLYLHRYWEYETQLAENLLSRARRDLPILDRNAVGESLRRLFPGTGTDGVNWQEAAAVAALCKPLCVVSGGPGTGKTSLITRLLALILEQHREREVRIKMAAPTGKAAARLQEAVKHIKEGLDTEEAIRNAILPEAYTIHRLLGSLPNSPYFRYDRNNPLPADVVVVDEASMVDLALMSKLTQAMSPSSRLILLGDKDQLASVEAGSVLGDICGTEQIYVFSQPFARTFRHMTGETLDTDSANHSGMQDCVIQLRKSYRFGSRSGIGALSREVNEGHGEAALGLLKSGRFPDVGYRPLPTPASLSKSLRTKIVEGYGTFLKAKDPSEAFQRLPAFRILCAVRRGPYGVHAMNQLAESALHRAGLLAGGKDGHRGRIVLISQNDYALSLFNGDIGIMLADPDAGGQVRAFFASPDGTIRRFSRTRLPEHETAFAMTVHKSQGSEFDHVLLMLPEQHAPVLTRELIYTGITRARERVEVWGREDVFLEAVRRRTERASGLREALWKAGTAPISQGERGRDGGISHAAEKEAGP